MFQVDVQGGVYTPVDLAAQMDCQPEDIYALIEAGELPAAKVAGNWFITGAMWMRFLLEQTHLARDRALQARAAKSS